MDEALRKERNNRLVIEVSRVGYILIYSKIEITKSLGIVGYLEPLVFFNTEELGRPTAT